MTTCEVIEKYDFLCNATYGFISNLKRNSSKLTSNVYGEHSEYFTHIPFSGINSIIDAILLVKHRLKVNWPLFCDAGAGYGFILRLAVQAGFNVQGIELDKFLVGELRRQITNAIEGDILAQDYSKFDVVYYYSPIADDELETQFEELVEDTLKVGAYIISIRKRSSRLRKDKRFKLVMGDKSSIGGSSGLHVFEKIKSEI